MIEFQKAIYALNPTVTVIRGYVAYDAEGNEVAYDKVAVEEKLKFDAQAAIDAKESALAKLAKLGLTEDEIKALVG